MRLHGVLPPIPTPFDGGGQVDAGAMSANVARWMQTRIRGVVVLGSNGEAPLLDEAESDAAIAAAREQVPSDRLCIAGTGRESTPAAIGAAKRAADLGADAVLVRTPSYFKPLLTPEAFVAHYTAVADASPAPVVLYNFTALTGVTLAVDVVARLAEHPNIIGMKESGSDLTYVSALIDATPDDFAVMAGSAPVFFPALAMGASGGVLAVASVATDLCTDLYDAVRAGRLGEARALQRRLTPVARLVTSAHGIPGLKAAVTLLGFTAGDPRPPLRPAGPAAVEQLRAAVESLRAPVA